jgi:DNA invertase Pin-like site-specific DNA recombinase
LKQLTQSVGDTLVVTRLSVLSYSVQNLLDVMYKLEEKDITLEAIEQQYKSKDTSSLDELLYYLTEFIEDLRKEKQAIGIYKAKQNGKRLGRPSKLNLKKVEKAIYLKSFNTSEQVANRFGVGRSTLLRHIAKLKKAG